MKVLLVSKEKTRENSRRNKKPAFSVVAYIVNTGQKKFSCNFGTIDLTKAKVGKKIKTNTGTEFLVLEPNVTDLLKKAGRGPQIITEKDMAQVAAVTGIANGWKCLDAGSGSGFASIMLANFVRPAGSVVTYEKLERNYNIAKKNVEYCGLEKIIKLKNKPAEQFVEKNLDLIHLDMPLAEKLVKKCYAALKSGGWLCVYSPHIEQQIRARSAMEKNGFIMVKTMETIQRNWSSLKGFTHPRPSGIVHTGFITFGRKF